MQIHRYFLFALDLVCNYSLSSFISMYMFFMLGCLLITYIQWNSSNRVHFRKLPIPHIITAPSFRIQHQLDKFTNEITLVVAIISHPFTILGIKAATVHQIILIIWLPIFKFQFNSAARVNPWTSFIINTNPSIITPSKDIYSFNIDLVIEILGVGFKKSSCRKSIHCCRFTHSLCIRVGFILRTNSVGNI